MEVWKILDYFRSFMKEWREKSANNQFVSTNLWFDVQSMCIWFRSMVAIKTAQFPSSVIKTDLLNQDGVENQFCQLRSCNGQNNNPSSVPKCVHCTERLFSTSCNKVTDINVSKDILRCDKRCFMCLKKGHLVDQCDKSCRNSKRRHHQSIC